MKQQIGKKDCPDCGAEGQPVYDDGRKVFLKCAGCGCLVNWQTRAGRARMLQTFKKPETEPEQEPATAADGGEVEPEPAPEKETGKTDDSSLFF